MELNNNELKKNENRCMGIYCSHWKPRGGSCLGSMTSNRCELEEICKYI